MKHNAQNGFTELKIGLSIAISALLIGCGEGKPGTGGDTNNIQVKPTVKIMPLNDTGVTFFIDDQNIKFPLTVFRSNASGDYLSVNGNMVNSNGARYEYQTEIDENGIPQQVLVYLEDINGDPIFEEVDLVQTTDDNGNLEFGANPTIYAANIAEYADQTNVIPSTSEPSNFPGQDGSSGRDTNSADNADVDGHLGFKFTKLDKDNGSALPADAVEFGCVKDEVTGLYWESKVNPSSASLSPYHELHNAKATHTWYDPSNQTSGGDNGQQATDSVCTTVVDDTYNFAKKVNEEALCGFSDWRVPTVEEMRSIVDYSVKERTFTDPAVDANFFPHIAVTDHRWTSQTYGLEPQQAFGFHLYEGRVQSHDKYCTIVNSNSYHNGTVLVRGVF